MNEDKNDPQLWVTPAERAARMASAPRPSRHSGTLMMRGGIDYAYSSERPKRDFQLPRDDDDFEE